MAEQAPATLRQEQPFEFYGVIDVEATCIEDRSAPFQNEIIELPCVVLSSRTLQPVAEFHRYVRPTVNPTLSEFCTKLTGIKQTTVDAAQPLDVVLGELVAWIEGQGLAGRLALATDGPWDLNHFLARECGAKGIATPPLFARWVNVRWLYAEFYRVRRCNVLGMMRRLGLSFHGRMHSGLWDARNIARIAARMAEDGCALRLNDGLDPSVAVRWEVPGAARRAGGLGGADEDGEGPAEAEGAQFYLVIDFEANCENGTRLRPQEIIEFPTVVVDAASLEVQRATEFHAYVRPTVHARLTPFCTELTGIEQRDVDGGVTIDEALRLHARWMAERGFLDERGAHTARSFVVVTCGDWDLGTCLPAELRHKGLRAPAYLRYGWLNVKTAFARATGKRGTGMAGMLRELGLELDGRHHSGIDDARNIAKIVVELLRAGVTQEPWRASDAALREALAEEEEQQRKKSKCFVEDPEVAARVAGIVGQELVQMVRDTMDPGQARDKRALISAVARAALMEFGQESLAQLPPMSQKAVKQEVSRLAADLINK
eukprot:m51a1_g8681 hypothetical protein (545) ;mRNA; f:181278-182985